MTYLPEHIKKELVRLQRYDDELTKIMPEDFKDWHQNSKEEWPEIAALVITQLREEVQSCYDELAGEDL